MVWSEGNVSLKTPVTPPGIDPGTVRLVAQRLNHSATPDPTVPEIHVYFYDAPSFLYVNASPDCDRCR
jgi:hypothetical protein